MINAPSESEPQPRPVTRDLSALSTRSYSSLRPAAMEPLDLRKQLECSHCHQVYRDPVSLKCGHSFCQTCIDDVLDTQQWSSIYSCPVCAEQSVDRPALHRNLALHSIAENYRQAEAKSQQQHPELIVLDEATRNKILRLRSSVKRLETEINETQSGVHDLEEQHRKINDQESEELQKINVLFADIGRQLGDLKRRARDEIFQQTRQLYHSLAKLSNRLLALKSELILQQQRDSDELSKIESSLTPDMLAELEKPDVSKTEEVPKRQPDPIQDVGALNMMRVLLTVHTGLCDVIHGVIHTHLQPIAEQEPSTQTTPTLPQPRAEDDLILDIDTASFQLYISDDRKSASRPTSQSRPDSPNRFWTFPQVLSTKTFSSGRHSWDVDVAGIDWCCVAACYHSIDRNGRSSKMEDNPKAWCLVKFDDHYILKHNWKEARPSVKASSSIIRVSLDYEAGQISFYQCCDPIQLLHTFTATFTEPLCAALGVYSEVGLMKIVGYKRGN